MTPLSDETKIILQLAPYTSESARKKHVKNLKTGLEVVYDLGYFLRIIIIFSKLKNTFLHTKL